MSAEQSSSVNAETVEQTKQQIRGLVSEIAQLSKSDLDPQEFYAAFLQRIVSALAAVGGAVWELGEGQAPRLAYQINISDTLTEADSEDAIRHVRLLSHVVHRNEPQLIPPLSGSSEEGAAGNPTRFLLVLAPLHTEGQVEGVVEIFQRPDSQPATQRGYLRFLVQMCDLAAEWMKSRKLRHFGERHSLWAQADHFSRLVHDSLDLRETAYTITNEGRRLIGCDRVTLAIKHGRKCKIEAISGQDTVESRSNVATLLSRLATRVLATGEPLWYEGSTEDLPPQVEEAVDAYVDESYTKSMAVLPLRKPISELDQAQRPELAGDPELHAAANREIIGALIIEQIETSVPREVLAPRIDLVYEHSARALSNSLQYSNIPLMPVWRTAAKSKWLVRGRTLPKTVTVGVLLLAALLAMFLVPGDFSLESRGKLQPVIRREVFVSVDGTVVELPFKDGAAVKQGDVLAVLRNEDLEAQAHNLAGQLSQTSEQLRSLRSTRLEGGVELNTAQRAELASRILELDLQANTLEQELKLIQAKLERLTIRSPIDGLVMLPWEVEDSLLYRPVTMGSALMTVADPTGEWEVELYMPEKRMGHVLRAHHELLSETSEPQLPVTYILATDPGTKRVGMVREIQSTTHLHEEEGHTVQIRVDIDKRELQRDRIEPRPGATVIGEIHCGERPIGYVWFHEAIEWVQTHLLF